MRLTRKAALLGAAFALSSVFTLAACSSDSSGPPATDLSGSYAVTAFWTGAPSDTPALFPVNGTATLTSTTYLIDIPGIATSEGDYAAFDNGTFTQDGTVTLPGQPAFPTQCTGTYTIVNSVLTIDTTCTGVRSITQLEPA